MFKVCISELTEFDLSADLAPILKSFAVSFLLKIIFMKMKYFKYYTCAQKMSYRWTMKLLDLGQIASTDFVHTIKSFAMSCLPKSNCTFHANMSIQNILSAHKKWVTGKRWNCLISINSRRQTFCIRSKVSHWVVYQSQTVLFMQIWVFRIVYLHTKNELPVNDETVWSQSTRVDRPFTYDQKFRNELFTKVKLYFSCKYEYSE